MLTFQELGGSPRETYSPDGFSATREFLVPWEQRADFALAVFGTKTQPVSQRRATYPGRKDVYADKLRFEPFEPDAVQARNLADLRQDLVDYDGSYAKAIVEYHTLDSRDRLDGPVNEEGTSISYRMVVESEKELVDPENWRWQDTYLTVPDDLVIEKTVPQTIHYVTWSNVVDPPWDVISARQGTINDELFLGCAPGTLLFEGAEANKLYRPGSGIDDEPSAFVWAIKYVFREKSIKFGQNVYGWNHFYRKAHGMWVEIYFNSTRLYDRTDFDALFRSTFPEDVP